MRFVRLNCDSFDLRYTDLDHTVDARTRLIAFTRTSNLIGTEVNPAPFVAAAQSVDAITYADGVAAAPHTSIAQNELGIDVSVCSAYKFFGPHLGILSASPELLDRLEPDRVRPAPKQDREGGRRACPLSNQLPAFMPRSTICRPSGTSEFVARSAR